MEIKTMDFAGVSIRPGSTLDYPTAWAIQKEVGQSLYHHPRCSSVPGWDPMSGPGMLCDCGALEREWERRRAEHLRPRFNEADAMGASAAWGCNCGPAALAFVMGLTLDEVRPHMGPFEQRGYTNVTNMRESLRSVGGSIDRVYEGWPPTGLGLIRIQWGGPWIIDGNPARWAARATHWVASQRTGGSHLYVFDINGGRRTYDSWLHDVVPAIIASIKRADGTWSISHSWGIVSSPAPAAPKPSTGG